MITGSALTLRILELLGTETIFAYPGGAVLPLYDAIPSSNIRSILVRNEQGAAFAAAGISRSSRDTVGVCLATSGPGALNLVTGIADAYSDNIPLLAITGQVAQGLIGSDAFQEVDTTGVCLPITKRTWIIRNPADIVQTLILAHHTALMGRPGPVVVDIPKDVQAAQLDLPEDWEEKALDQIRGYRELRNVSHAIPDEEMRRVFDLLRSSKKPLIIAGHGIVLGDCVPDFRHFVEEELIPCVTTIHGIGLLPRDHVCQYDWIGMHGMKYANNAVQNADCIIALGIRFDDRITGKLADFAPHAQIIHVDIDEGEAAKNVPTHTFIHAHLRDFFAQWIPTNTKHTRAEWFHFLVLQKLAFPKLIPDGRCTIAKVCSLIDEVIAPDAYVVTDVGQHQMWAAQYISTDAGKMLKSGGLGTMGFSFPTSMGVTVSHPECECWSISGDGGFQMNIQELGTVSQEKIPVKIIILDNGYLGMVRQWQEQFYAHNYSGVTLQNPDFVKIAEAYGIPGKMVHTVSDVIQALKDLKNSQGPFLLHIRVIQEENVYPMVPSGVSLSDTVYYPKGIEEEGTYEMEDSKITTGEITNKTKYTN